MKKGLINPLLWRRAVIVLLILFQLALIAYTLISRSMVSTLLGSGLTLLSLLVCLHIIAKHDKEAYKLTWVFTIMLFPLFGGAFYLLCSFQPIIRRLSRTASQADVKVGAAYALDKRQLDEACAAAPMHSANIKYLENFTGYPVYGHTKTTYLTPGEVKFRRLIQELKKAEKYIFMEYFIIEEGVMWNTILDVLKERARAGVKVRLMYDDMGCMLLLPQNYPAKLREYGIECRVFNPLRPLLTTVQNNRDHRKITVIDGKVAFTGGVNLADEYINEFEKYGHWKDAAIVTEGRAAWSFALIFLKMWELCSGADEDYAQYYPWSHTPAPTLYDGYVQPYADSPMDRENTGEQVYLSIINSARKYLYINTPYFVVDDAMVTALCHAAKSGVDIRIVTPHKWDKWAVHMTTRSYYRDLIRAGVKVYEYTNGFIHSKTFVSDDSIATVGTVNMDFRSLYLHFECGAVLYGCDAVMDIKEDFLKTLDICHRITQQDCKSGMFMRLFQDVMRLFAPLI